MNATLNGDAEKDHSSDPGLGVPLPIATVSGAGSLSYGVGPTPARYATSDSMSRPIQSRADVGRRQAIWLIIPSLIIVVATASLLPWLLETRGRLQNDYWEGQLYIAAVSLCIAASGVPFVILRSLRRVPYLCPLGWLVVASGYFAMTIYMLQSHFPANFQSIFVIPGVACLLIAIRGLVADTRHTDSIT